MLHLKRLLGVVGARFLNTGNFGVALTASILFTNSDVITKIKANETVSLDFALRNDNGAVVVDIPSMTLGGGNQRLSGE